MNCKYGLWVTIGLAMATVQAARAELVLEYDFRTAQTTATSAIGQASVTANGGSPDADLIQGATINHNSTALGPGYDPRVETGYLSIRPVAGDDQALGTANTIAGPDHLMQQYMGTTNFSTGSIVMVFKPQFSGLDANRRTFFWHGSTNSSNDLLWLLNNDDLLGPSLTRNQGNLVSLPNVIWDADTWYMLAASWMSNLEADRENVMYLRPFSPLSVAQTNIENVVFPDGTVPQNLPIYLGRRQDTLNDSANSNIALFQLHNTALKIDDYNAIYNELAMIPEPASLQLLLLGSIGIVWCARRRRGKLV